MTKERSTNKVMLEAILSLENLPLKRRKEIASKLELPENDQKDLLFLSAILVSTGVNANGAAFLGSELIKAKDSIANKPLNVEHVSEKVIGHISSCIYMTHDGVVLDENDLYSKLMSENAADADKLIAELDNTDMDIGIICVVYKDSFPDIAEEIKKGEWKVSMECYYDDFDLKIGNTIVNKASVNKEKEKAIDPKVKKALEEVISKEKVSSFNVSRILRGIRFCGCGIVKNPAEKRAVILEAANYMKKTVNRELNEIKEAANEETEKPKESPFKEDSLNGEVVQIGSTGYLLVKNGQIIDDSYFADYNKAQQEAIARTAIAKKAGEDVEYSIVSMNSIFVPRDKIQINETSEAIIYKTGESAKIKEIINIGENKEAAGLAMRKWGPQDNRAGVCISFKKYKYEYPGSPFQGRIVATNWCQRYQKPCPVIGADATDPTCLKNLYGKAYETELDKVATNFSEEDKLSYMELVDLYSDSAPPVEDVKDDPKPLDIPEDLNTQPSVPPKQRPINKQEAKKKEIKDFSKLLGNVNKEERTKLDSKYFGLSKDKQFPLHTKELVQATMDLYPEISNSLKSFANKRELFNSIIYNALRLGISTKEFEKNSQFKFRADKEFNEDYGVPRLKLFPLESREQVIAAISRYGLIKVNISDQEREQLVINILRAAAKFNIDVTRFRERVRNN